MPYPYADVTGIRPGVVPSPTPVITAVGGVDSAIENLRLGDISFAQMRLELNPVPIEVVNNTITINGSYHLVKTSEAYAVILTIQGTNQGDVLCIERAWGSGDILIGEYILHEVGAQAWIEIKASGYNVLGSSGKRITPAFFAYKNTSQIISAGVATVIQFNAITYNQYCLAPSTTTRPCFFTDVYQYSPNGDGLYEHKIGITWNSIITAGAIFLVLLQKNSTTIAQATYEGNGIAGQTCQLRFQDYANTATPIYQVLIQQLDAGSRILETGATRTWWSATRIGNY